LDAHQDENLNSNKGYHIIDQADLAQTEDDEEAQDEEVRQYQYNNMLEDLKYSIEQENHKK
jgi:hypothetical protein